MSKNEGLLHRASVKYSEITVVGILTLSIFLMAFSGGGYETKEEQIFLSWVPIPSIIFEYEFKAGGEITFPINKHEAVGDGGITAEGDTHTHSQVENMPSPNPPPPPPVAPPVRKGQPHKELFAEHILHSLGIHNYSQHAIDFLVAWQKIEGCGGNNPFCKLTPTRKIYSYSSIEFGARSFAAQLDINHPNRPPEWRYHYPDIVQALRDSYKVVSAEEIVNMAHNDLRRWCGPHSLCGDTAEFTYQEKLLYVLERDH